LHIQLVTRDDQSAARSCAQHIARECLGSRARRLTRLISRHYDEALRPHGVTAAQFQLLVGIALAGSVQATALGRILDLEKSTLSRNLARMVAKGWVTSGRELELTAAGARLLRKGYPSWQSAQRQVEDRLGGQAVPILDELTRGMRAD
jgi:DNA-binding MarR family transcriptional regulator